MAGGARALPDLVSRIRVDSTGVDAAILAMVGGFGRANAAMITTAGLLGLIVLGGKSFIDIAEKQDAAERSLAQAVDVYNAKLGKTTKAHTDYVVSAKKSAQYDKELAAARHAVASASAAVDVAQQRYTRDLYTYGPQAQATMKAELGLEAAKSRLTQTQLELNKMQQQGVGAYVRVGATQARSRIDLELYEKALRTFIKTNARYISDQSQVTNGAAQLLRSGLSQKEVQLDLNRALDLGAIKHISYSDAVDLVDQAEHGRYRGLIDLGIATKNYTDANGKALTGAKLAAAVMKDLDQKTKGGRQTLTETQQISNKLANDWQTLASKGGPPLIQLLDDVLGKASDIYDKLDSIGKDDALWGRISDRLVTWADELKPILADIGEWIWENIIFPLMHVFQIWPGDNGAKIDISHSTPAFSGGTGPGHTHPGKKKPKAAAQGGPVLPGGVYTVGEEGEETLVMGARGGYIIPNQRRQGGGGLTVLPVIFSPVPPNREQVAAMSDAIRRLDREHR